MVDRIKQIMEYEGMTPAIFAETIGINRSNLTHIFSGRNQPSLDLAKKILNAFPEIKTEWLIMGVGEMTQPVDKDKLVKDVAVPIQPDLFSGDYNIPQPEPTPVVKEPEPELVERRALPRRTTTRNKSNITDENTKKPQKSDSQEAKTLKKIVFFYSDNSFETFYPQM